MMRRTVLLLAMVCAAPAVAGKPKLPPCPPPGPQLFISPAGEPFRAGPGAPYPVADWFARADADHDGRLTLAEMTADAQTFFKVVDTDHDGEIIPEELSHYERVIAPEIQLFSPRGFGPEAEKRARKAKKKAFVYGEPIGAGRYGLLNIPEPISAADEDFNRGVTPAEMASAVASRFRQIDTAKQGFLTLATLPRTPTQVMPGACDPGLPMRTGTGGPPR